MKKSTALILFGLMVIGMSCSEENRHMRMEITRLDTMIESGHVIPEDSAAMTMYMDIMQVPGDDLSARMSTFRDSRAFEVFGHDVNERITAERLDSIESVLVVLEQNVKRVLPEVKGVRYYGVISPFQQPLMKSDTTMFVVLNHFLGPDYPGYGAFDEQTRNSKQLRNIPYFIARARLREAYPFDSGMNPSVIDKMLYEGAVDYSALKLSDNNELAPMLGWTTEDAAAVSANEPKLWEELVMSNQLFSEDPVVSEAVINGRLQSDMPTGIGRYLGWRIVKSYMENNDGTTLPFLMSPGFYASRQSLIDAGYNP